MSTKIKTISREGMKKWNTPGLAIGIVKDGKLAWEGYFGYANIEKRTAGDAGHCLPDRIHF